MITPTQRDQLNHWVDLLVPECKDVVRQITSQPCLTKDRYDQYMNVLSRMADGKKEMGFIAAIALIKAGANKDGVLAAHRILFGGERQ